jgi:pimeloyl-ACP methyl ester carboxylesterase/class 3 adenylate cyclase
MVPGGSGDFRTMDIPETRYARSGDVSIAYQVVGEGPFDVVYVPGFLSNVERVWQVPTMAALYRHLASFTRLIIVDKRGTGMSDRVSNVATLETRMDDARAVMDAVGSSRAAIFGGSEGSPMSILFAATYPDRATALVLRGSFARSLWAPDYPWGWTEDQSRDELESDLLLFSDRGSAERMISSVLGGQEARQMVDYFRSGGSPGVVKALYQMDAEIDVRPVLPAIRVPTLMLHGELDHIPIAGARWMADQIPGARFLELPGARHVPMGEALKTANDEVECFLTEVRQSGDWKEQEPDRILATVLFTDIVSSSEKAASVGDRAWRELLQRHHELVRRQLVRFRGKEVDTAGDGFLASFGGPARAIRCAQAVVEGVHGLGLQVRAGLHTGECELLDGKVAGIAVHTGARVAAEAAPGEVLVSSTVKDLVAGSGLAFQDRGTHELKGVPGEWRLFALQTA